jgi:predicted secreted protein
VTSHRVSELRFDQFVDTEETDLLSLQVSADAGQTWQTLPYRLGDQEVTGGYAVGLRSWQRGVAAIPAGSDLLRWTYTQDAALSGRGVYVDSIRLTDGRRTVVDLERNPRAGHGRGLGTGAALQPVPLGAGSR